MIVLYAMVSFGNIYQSLFSSFFFMQVPEFASWFSVNISTTASGAVITNGGSGLFSTCNITMLESDYPAGRIGFSDSYRLVLFKYCESGVRIINQPIK